MGVLVIGGIYNRLFLVIDRWQVESGKDVQGSQVVPGHGGDTCEEEDGETGNQGPGTAPPCPRVHGVAVVCVAPGGEGGVVVKQGKGR